MWYSKTGETFVSPHESAIVAHFSKPDCSVSLTGPIPCDQFLRVVKEDEHAKVRIYQNSELCISTTQQEINNSLQEFSEATPFGEIKEVKVRGFFLSFLFLFCVSVYIFCVFLCTFSHF